MSSGSEICDRTVPVKLTSPSSDGVRSSCFNSVEPKYSIFKSDMDFGISYVDFSEFGLKVLSAIDFGIFLTFYDGNRDVILQNQVIMKRFSSILPLLSYWELFLMFCAVFVSRNQVSWCKNNTKI